MANMADKETKVSFWKERNPIKLARDHPLGLVALLIGSLLLWYVIIFPLIDKLPDERQGNVVPVRLVSATTTDGDATALSPPRGCELGCTPTTASKQFRQGRISAGRGLSAQRIFVQPKKAKRVIINKYQRLIRNRYGGAHARGVTMTAGGMCTTDSYSCGEQWYQAAMNARCTAAGDLYAGGRGRCSEYPAFKYTIASIRERFVALACASGFAALALPKVSTASRVLGFPGATTGCWAVADRYS